jgi:hypothetical protein
MAFSPKPDLSLLLPFFITFYIPIVFTFNHLPAWHHLGFRWRYDRTTMDDGQKGNSILFHVQRFLTLATICSFASLLFLFFTRTITMTADIGSLGPGSIGHDLRIAI